MQQPIPGQCVFEPIADQIGFYRCALCDWQNKTPRDRPPRRNCGKAPEKRIEPIGLRTEHEVERLIAEHCATCDYFSADREICKLDKGCKKNATPLDWRRKMRDRRTTCPLDRWNEWPKLTLGITTYLRPACLERLLSSISRYYPGAMVDVIDTEGNLSRGRNELVRRCETEFLWILEDDFAVRADTNVQAALSILGHASDVGVVCGRLHEQGGTEDYALDMRLFRRELELTEPPAAPVRYTPDGAAWRYCDCGFNFFIARTAVLRAAPWDEELELHEHAAWFLSLQQQGLWRVAFCPQFTADHSRDRSNSEYIVARNRAKLFQPILSSRYGFDRIRYNRPNSGTGNGVGFAMRGRRFDTPAARTAARQAAVDFAALAGGVVFPICGTLLGLVREGDVISHDCDVDFGCFEFANLDRLGEQFVRQREFHHHGQLSEIAFIHHSGVKVDLFKFFQAGGSHFYVIYPDEFPERPTIIRRFPTDTLTLGPSKQWGGDLQMFTRANEWLERNYGPEWRTPDPTFTYQP